MSEIKEFAVKCSKCIESFHITLKTCPNKTANKCDWFTYEKKIHCTDLTE